MTANNEMEGAIEAILFVATEPVAQEKLCGLFPGEEKAEVLEALEGVLARYRGDSARGVMVDMAGGGARLVTRPQFHGYLRNYFQVSSRTKLSMASLETLAIIAYRQPVTAPEIQELRGVNSSGVLKTLLEHRLIRIAGRKEVVGKPFLYCTSKGFLLRFGLNRLKDLPPLEEIDELLAGQLEVGTSGEADRDGTSGTLLLWQKQEDEQEPSASEEEE